MSQKGWISIYRQLRESWIWNDKPFDKTHAWLDLLLSANHQDNKTKLGNEIIVVPRGSFITSELKLMERWGWSKTKLRSFLKLLEEDEMIIKKSDRKKTTITIVNYSVYQESENHEKTTEKPQKDHEKTTERPIKDTNNNDNNSNNENKLYIKANKLVYDLYETLNFGFINGANIVVINEDIKVHGIEQVEAAMKKTSMKNITSWGYVQGVLKSLNKGGAKSYGKNKSNVDTSEGDKPKNELVF